METKVIIKSPADLPEKNTECYFRKKATFDLIKYWSVAFMMNEFFNDFDWYLLPIDLPTDVEANNKACHIYANASNPDDKILAFIDGFEWLRDKLLNNQ